jgi:hypothetical protein
MAKSGEIKGRASRGEAISSSASTARRWRRGAARFDVFISYRRSGGSHLGQYIHSELTSRGYKTFIDVNAMQSGRFDEALLSAIERATDVVVLLTENCMDRCSEADDWFHREIAHALATKRNVVPLIDSRFIFPPPRALPEDIRLLPKQNGLTYVHEYSAATVNKLCGFLRSKPRPRRKRIWTAIAVSAALLAGGALVYRSGHGGPSESHASSGQSRTLPSSKPSTGSSPGSQIEMYAEESGRHRKLNWNGAPLSAPCGIQIKPLVAAQGNCYLLDIDGEGQPAILDAAQMVEGHWVREVSAAPSETLLLLETSATLTEADKRQMTESIYPLHLSPVVERETQIAWGDGRAQAVPSDKWIAPRGSDGTSDPAPKTPAWCQGVLDVLVRTRGLSFSGVTVPVE